MKKVKHVIVFIGVIAACIFASAENKTDKKQAPQVPDKIYKARIDINGISGKVKFKAVKGCRAWPNGQVLTAASAPLKDDGKWITLEFSFLPENDGYVMVTLLGPGYVDKKIQKGPIPAWVDFDDIVVSGTELQNGDFEQVDEKGLPLYWVLKGKMVPGEKGNAVRVWHNQQASQKIEVKKDVEVSITARVKRVGQ
jgi:hypothetical protein